MDHFDSNTMFRRGLYIVVLAAIAAFCHAVEPPNCPANKPFVNCTLSPCNVSVPCVTSPTAVCKPDYCGGCVAKFYDRSDNNEVHCEEEVGIICELKNTTIGCLQETERNKVMKILFANYGRTSDIKCRHPYNTSSLHESLNCSAANSTKIIRDLCEGKRTCHPDVSNAVFGDPCYGTYKYLEVDWQCVDPGTLSSVTRNECSVGALLTIAFGLAFSLSRT